MILGAAYRSSGESASTTPPTSRSSCGVICLTVTSHGGVVVSSRASQPSRSAGASRLAGSATSAAPGSLCRRRAWRQASAEAPRSGQGSRLAPLARLGARCGGGACQDTVGRPRWSDGRSPHGLPIARIGADDDEREIPELRSAVGFRGRLPIDIRHSPRHVLSIRLGRCAAFS